MKTDNLRIIPANRARHAIYALVFVSLLCSGMLTVHLIWGKSRGFSGLFFNLFLAWIPLLLSLFIPRIASNRNRLQFWGAMVLWILFYPNAFYMVTDVIHIKIFGTGGVFRWFDMMMLASFASCGIFIGSLSLYLMHLFVRQRAGWLAGWLFAVGTLALGSFGIYLGRALRLNSWDVVAHPLKMMGGFAALIEPRRMMEGAGFSLMFFFFSLAAYSFVVSIARLHEGESSGR